MKPLQIAVTVVVAALAACGGDPAVDARGILAQETTWNWGEPPVGTFEAFGTEHAEMARIVLMADGTSHLEFPTICQGILPCEPRAIDGYYRASVYNEVHHLDFLDEEGKVLHDCDYRYEGKLLEITHEGDTTWQPLARASSAWCAIASHCEQQWLPAPLCPGRWQCVYNRCQFTCEGRQIWDVW